MFQPRRKQSPFGGAAQFGMGDGPKAVEEVDHEMLAITEDSVHETFSERVVGLSEVVPESVRKYTGIAASASITAINWSTSTAKKLAWYGVCAFCFGFVPTIVMSERAVMINEEEMRKRNLISGMGGAMGGPGLGAQFAPR